MNNSFTNQLTRKMYAVLKALFITAFITGILLALYGVMVFYEWWYFFAFIVIIIIARVLLSGLHKICKELTDWSRPDDEHYHENTLGTVITVILAIPMLLYAGWLVIGFTDTVKSKAVYIVKVEPDGDYSARHYYSGHEYEYLDEHGNRQIIKLEGGKAYVDNQYNLFLRYYEVGYSSRPSLGSGSEDILNMCEPHAITLISGRPDYIMKDPPRTISVKRRGFIKDTSATRRVLQP